MHDLAVTLGFPYGAPDLKKVYRKYLTIAELLGIGVIGLFLGAYYLGIFLSKEEEPVHVVRIMKYSELGPHLPSKARMCRRRSQSRLRRSGRASAFRCRCRTRK